MSTSLFYVVTRDEKEALMIGEALVREKIVACANLIPQMKSLYFWQGVLQQDSECILILKAPSQNFRAACEKIQNLHSYENPCILEVPVSTGAPAYLQWILSSTNRSEGSR